MLPSSKNINPRAQSLFCPNITWNKHACRSPASRKGDYLRSAAAPYQVDHIQPSATAEHLELIVEEHMMSQVRIVIMCLVTLLVCPQWAVAAAASAAPPSMQERMVEWTFKSHKPYADPFNDVDVDVIFSKDGQSWRVPTFWRGGEQWTVRFAPPAPGEYSYQLQSTDSANPDLNGHEGRVTIAAYSGSNELLRHGLLRVSVNKRYFEHADGTPFYWLGDTWWKGLSDRLSWEGFQTLAADREAKGFTIVQIVAGLVPEEQAPRDPGFHNEGGAVWDPQFKRINPKYFDYADRRIQFLLDHGMVPAIVGGWGPILLQMGVPKMKQHWRYIIARYGAYPAFWILGGQVSDPPEAVVRRYQGAELIVPGWTEVARYLRATDPYHHPLTVHEDPPPYDTALQDESLIDFDMFQSSHFGWASIGLEVAQINQHYSRTQVTKPVVEGEIGYEKLGETHFEDFQRTAFWLSMLNGAAGHTYGANGVWESYTPSRPFSPIRYSLMTWEEGMNLPGSYQVGMGAKLLRKYPWWRFAPHPEWVTPRGTTLLEPHPQINGFDFGPFKPCEDCEEEDPIAQLEVTHVAAEWKAQHGTFRLPYAAGIPGEVRFIYVPTLGVDAPAPPTVLGLEPGVRYHAFWWEPSTGTRIDLGAVARPLSGPVLFDSSTRSNLGSTWKEFGSPRPVLPDSLTSDTALSVVKNKMETNAVVSLEAQSAARVGLVLRCQDSDNYVAAVYSPEDKSLYLIDRRLGADGPKIGKTPIPELGAHIKMSAEARADKAATSITDGERTYTTPIVDLSGTAAGMAGLLYHGRGLTQRYTNFQLRGSPALIRDEHLLRSLSDAKGMHRGDLVGSGMTIGNYNIPGWSELGREKFILLDAYRPDRMPMSGDWVLVLENN